MQINQLIQSEDILGNQPEALSQGKKIPPVETWQPKHHFDMDLVIKSNGEWWHEGTQIIKQKLIDLFATILWCEEDDKTKHYFLQSPVEKAKITVEDVPLMVTAVSQISKDDVVYLEFHTQTGDIVTASHKNPIYMSSFINELGKVESRFYIRIRRNLDAFINRNTFMELVNYGKLTEKDNKTVLELASGDSVFILTADDL